MNPSPHRDPLPPRSSVTLEDALEESLRFGTMMLRSGDTAFRVRASMTDIARRMGVELTSVQLVLGSITAAGRLDGDTATRVREVGPPGVNSGRICALEALARSAPSEAAVRDVAAKLDAIEQSPPRYSAALTGAAVGAACGAFAVLNGGGGLEVIAATIGGGAGQCLRTLLLRRRFNQYAVTALCGLVASGVYCAVSAAATYAGFGAARHTAGFISSVLFLVPGFPFVAALLDLLQHETSAAVTRLAYAVTILLAAAFGMSVIVALVGFAVEAPVRSIDEPLAIVVRALASFVGASGFAVLFNSSPRNVFYVGLLAIVGNELRLGLHDAGLSLPAATLLGAMAVGLTASLAGRWLDESRVALTVPGVIIMVPGMYAFQTFVLFNQGEILPGLRAALLVVFVVMATAAGLAAARFVTQPEWLRE